MTTEQYGYAEYFEGCPNSLVRDVIKTLVREVLVNEIQYTNWMANEVVIAFLRKIREKIQQTRGSGAVQRYLSVAPARVAQPGDSGGGRLYVRGR